MFMGFSITSAVFGGIIISSYSRAIAFYRNDYRFVYEQGYNDYNPTDSYQYNYGLRRVRKDNFDTEMALSAIILILGIVEFVIGIWAAVCLCMMKSCTCCYGNQQQVSCPRLMISIVQPPRKSVILRNSSRTSKQMKLCTLFLATYQRNVLVNSHNATDMQLILLELVKSNRDSIRKAREQSLQEVKPLNRVVLIRKMKLFFLVSFASAFYVRVICTINGCPLLLFRLSRFPIFLDFCVTFFIVT